MKNLILASASPRRQALLRQIGIPFEVMTEDCDEETDGTGSPEETVMELALRKANNFCEKRQVDAVVLTADTLVWQDGRSLGKPAGAEDAVAMLKSLRGKRHYVYTGVCIADKASGNIKCFADSAEVYMRDISDKEILDYVATGEPFGKAGAYAIQGKGAFLVEKITGDYNTIVGLPLTSVCLALRDFGFDLTELWR